MSTRQQRRVAARLTPLLVRLFEAEPNAHNLRFHSYPPTNFASAASCCAIESRGPPAQWAKRLFT